MPLGDLGKVSFSSPRDRRTDYIMEQRRRLLELHERIYYFLGTVRGGYGHRRVYFVQR